MDLLAHLRADSARFDEVLAGADPGAPVPTCAGWTADDLLWHLSEVQHFWGTIVQRRLADPDAYEPPDRPATHAELLGLFRRSHALLAEALATTPDEVPVWTWLDHDQSVGFVRRRQAHEALVHRLDAELTVGALTPVDPALATDGVLEAIEWMFGGAPAWASTRRDGPVGRLATTDTDATWWVQVGHWSGTSPSSGTTYTDELLLFLVEGGTPAFEITATARDLDAWIWNRPPLGEVVRTGDTSLFETVVHQGVQ